MLEFLVIWLVVTAIGWRGVLAVVVLGVVAFVGCYVWVTVSNYLLFRKYPVPEETPKRPEIRDVRDVGDVRHVRVLDV